LLPTAKCWLIYNIKTIWVVPSLNNKDADTREIIEIKKNKIRADDAVLQKRVDDAKYVFDAFVAKVETHLEQLQENTALAIKVAEKDVKDTKE